MTGKLSVTGTTNGQSHRPLTAYEGMVRSLSDRLVEAQRPIRILDAIKWDDDIERVFFDKGCRELPPVTREFYLSRPLPFDPEKKLNEFHVIERDIRRQLGEFNAPGQIMARMCQEYREVVHMLTHRGTPVFGEMSERLYGSASDSFHAGDPNLADLGHMMSDILDNLSHETIFGNDEPTLDSGQAVLSLATRLQDYFQDTASVHVEEVGPGLGHRHALDAVAQPPHPAGVRGEGDDFCDGREPLLRDRGRGRALAQECADRLFPAVDGRAQVDPALVDL